MLLKLAPSTRCRVAGVQWLQLWVIEELVVMRCDVVHPEGLILFRSCEVLAATFIEAAMIKLIRILRSTLVTILMW